MEVALIGFKQSGKSTLLSAISGKKAALPGSMALDKAIVPVPDPRIDWLTKLYKPKKTVLATIDCTDLPGVSFIDAAERSAARRFLGQLKAIDMCVLVVRGFENDAVPPYRGSIDPQRDIKELQSEFLLSDLEIVLNRIERLQEQIQKVAKTQDHDKLELAVQQKLQTALEAEKPASTVELSPQEYELIKSLGLFTLKPLMVVVNVSEDKLGEQLDLSKTVNAGVPVVALCAKIEQELSQLDPQSRTEFMSDLGISVPAANKFVASCYTAMGLISFLTVGEDEVRAWPIRRQTLALDAAGKVHSDIRRGFIRAETMAYDDLSALGDEKAVRAAGKMRLEGKTYEVQDGDIINFRFNV